MKNLWIEKKVIIQQKKLLESSDSSKEKIH